MRDQRVWVRIALWLAVVAWMATLFAFSNQTGEQSGDLSGDVIRAVAAVVQPGFEQLPPAEQSKVISQYQLATRKAAHFSVYLVLGALAAIALLQHPMSNRGRFGAAMLIAFGYAATDEIHQLFVDGRGGQGTDVLIDSAGALVGIAAALMIARRIHSKRIRAE